MIEAHNKDVKAIVPVFIWDRDEKIPIMISLLGGRNAVRGMMSRAFSKGFYGDDATPAFHITGLHGDDSTMGFALPNQKYRQYTENLADTRMIEGRILTRLADQSMIDNTKKTYIMVHGDIDWGNSWEAGEEVWVKYLAWREQHWPDYQPPMWCEDLYKVFLALKARLSIPVHPTWMVYTFYQMRHSTKWINGDRIEPVVFYEGFLSPELVRLNQTDRLPIETGAYRLICDPAETYWREAIISNPHRAKWIKFASK